MIVGHASSNHVTDFEACSLSERGVQVARKCGRNPANAISLRCTAAAESRLWEQLIDAATLVSQGKPT